MSAKISSHIPDLVTRLIAMHDGRWDLAAESIGTSKASLSRWASGESRPRVQIETRLRAKVEGAGDLVALATLGKEEHRFERLEEAISGTIHALREEFHRTASVSNRQEVLDLVAVLFFAHVTSIDSGGNGIGPHLLTQDQSAVEALNLFVHSALMSHLPQWGAAIDSGKKISAEKFFSGLVANDEKFATNLLTIFGRDANAFVDLHKAGRDDLINEVFSRFMSTSFVDEKEMGQYLTPPEIVRFMVELAICALSPESRAKLLSPNRTKESSVILDPSCGVGSFLAETARYCHAKVRGIFGAEGASTWLQDFVAHEVYGIDKSERMVRLAMINLGLFGVTTANLVCANGLAREGEEGALSSNFEGKAQLILTNPPFGASYASADVQHFKMGEQRNKADSEVLFLERYIDWLAPGGIVASIVPDSILVNRGPFAALRSMLYDRCEIIAVISLPPSTFGAAGTTTKTSVLVLKRSDKKRADNLTFFAEAREIGFDVVTRSGQRRRVRRDENDLPALIAEFSQEVTQKLGRSRKLSRDSERWDAGFHIPDALPSVCNSAERLLKVSDVAKLVDIRIDPRRLGEPNFNYIEISDVDTRSGLVSHKLTPSGDAPSRARKQVKSKDVIVSTVRPERGSIGVIPDQLDGAICSTGFAVLRCININPGTLVGLLKTDFVKKQMVRNNIGIAYPAISESTCLELILPVSEGSLPALNRAAEDLAAAQSRFESAKQEFSEQLQLHASKSEESF